MKRIAVMVGLVAFVTVHANAQFGGSVVYDPSADANAQQAHSARYLQAQRDEVERQETRQKWLQDFNDKMEQLANYATMIQQGANTLAYMSEATQQLTSGDWQEFKQGLLTMSLGLGEASNTISTAADNTIFTSMLDENEATGVATSEMLTTTLGDMQRELGNMSSMINVTERTIDSTIARAERMENLGGRISSGGGFTQTMQLTSQIMGETQGQIADLTMMSAAAEKWTRDRQSAAEARIELFKRAARYAAQTHGNETFQEIYEEVTNADLTPSEISAALPASGLMAGRPFYLMGARDRAERIGAPEGGWSYEQNMKAEQAILSRQAEYGN